MNAKETVKTIVLALLVLAGVVLTALLWQVQRPDSESLPSQRFERLLMLFGLDPVLAAKPAYDYDLSPFCGFVSASWNDSGTLFRAEPGVGNLSLVSDTAENALANFFSDRAVYTPVSPDVFRKAADVSGFLLLDLGRELDMQSLSVLLADGTLQTDGMVRYILLSGTPMRMLLANAKLEHAWAADLKQDAGTGIGLLLRPLTDAQAGAEAVFFSEKTGEPFTAFTAASPRLADLTVQNTRDAALHEVMKSFGFNSFSMRKYQESDGTVIYVESFGELRLEPDGLLRFTAEEEGIPLSKLSLALGRSAGDALRASCILISSLPAETRGGTASVTVRSFTYDSAAETFRTVFGYRMGGADILADRSACTVDVQNGRIIAAEIRLCSFSAGTDKKVLMPAEDAYLFLSRGGRDPLSGMRIIYRSKQTDAGPVCTPEWHAVAPAGNGGVPTRPVHILPDPPDYDCY